MKVDLKEIAVIGGGIAGIAVAIRAAAKGHKVTLFEANSQLGGKIAELRTDRYRFDVGPTVLTMPHYIDELFTVAGEDARDHFSYQRLDTVFQYLFDDGSRIHTYADTDKLIDEFVAKTTVHEDDLRTFFRRSKEKLELTDEVFLQRSLHQWRNYFDRPTARGLLQFHKVQAFTTMAKANARLLKDPKVTAIFNQYAGYNGSDPFAAPATLNLISHYELGLGSYHPRGGMYAIVTALTELLHRLGVRVETGTRVERIHIEKQQAQGVQVNGELQRFDQVVSNADTFKSYPELMPGIRRPTRVLDQPKSSSVIVFYWGMQGHFPELGLHNMFMGGDQQEENHAIFQRGTICDDPSVYVCITSRKSPADAPLDGENWFCMVTAPNNTGQDWDRLIAHARKAVVRKVNATLNKNITPHIEFESVLEPRLIEKRWGSAFGSVYGNSSNGMFAAFLRHPNFSSRIRDLFFCGGSVHPGSSIPLCLLSAKITAKLMDG